MLKHLYIRNYALIDELNIDFSSGFSVITGETGAGKSIIVGAIGLLLGGRSDAKYVKNGQNRCVIEAHFDISRYSMSAFFMDNDIDYEPDDCIMRREINANGKSRAFINDTPVQLTLMRELGESLMDVHSQHQNLLLNKEDFQLEVIDIIAHSQTKLDEYRGIYRRYSDAKRQLEDYRDALLKSCQNADFLRYEYNELTQLGLKENEQTLIETEVDAMKHSEEIKSTLYAVANSLDNDNAGVLSSIREAENRLRDISSFYPAVNDLAQRLADSYVELKDVNGEISSVLEDIDYDPGRLSMLTERLDAIYTLENKYHVKSDTELFQLISSIGQQLQQIDNSDDSLQEMEANVNTLHSECEALAASLHAIREKSAAVVEEQMRKRLSPLGIPNVNFKVQLTAKSLSENGCDKVAFLFSANKNGTLQPVSQVASGGEISRVMLSIKAMISGEVNMPTIVFDEIDTGVSGRVAEKMALIMSEIGKHDRQVIAITHLPQIAAMGRTHYKVAKTDNEDGTTSSMTMLSHDERVREIASMLSGSDITQAAVSNAEELLAMNKECQ